MFGKAQLVKMLKEWRMMRRCNSCLSFMALRNYTKTMFKIRSLFQEKFSKGST